MDGSDDCATIWMYLTLKKKWLRWWILCFVYFATIRYIYISKLEVAGYILSQYQVMFKQNKEKSSFSSSQDCVPLTKHCTTVLFVCFYKQYQNFSIQTLQQYTVSEKKIKNHESLKLLLILQPWHNNLAKTRA